MLNLIDEISKEWSNRIPSGIIDLKNENHKIELLRVLNTKIQNDKIVGEIINNIYDNN